MRSTAAYVIDGVRVPSVTEVLKIAGLVDYSRIEREVLDRAAARGQETHHWIAVLDEGGAVEAVDPIVVGRLAAYKEFRSAQVFARAQGEASLVSTLHRVGGTPDLVGALGPAAAPAVLDVKPPGPVQPWWELQVAGYQMILEELRGSPVQGFVLQLRNEGTFRLTRVGHSARHDFAAALRCVHYRLRHGMARLEG